MLQDLNLDIQLTYTIPTFDNREHDTLTPWRTTSAISTDDLGIIHDDGYGG